MSTKRLLIITGTRADYGILTPVINRLLTLSEFTTELLVTGSHLVKSMGYTLNEVVANGHPIAAKVDILDDSQSKYGMAKATGRAVTLFTDEFGKINPDLVLVLGDRFESFAAAQTAVLMNIPVAHIHGGETSEGAVDDYLRHAMTKLSDLHFCATQTFKQRIEAMGEQPSRVFCVGAPGLDNILHLERMSKAELFESIDAPRLFSNLPASKLGLVTFHPATRETQQQDPKILVDWLSAQSDMGFIITAANADDGGEALNESFRALAQQQPERFVFIPSLGLKRYLSALSHVGVVIGNSSSGLIEVPSFGIPTINIGQRQQGRLKPDSVIDCNMDKASLDSALAHCQNDVFRQQCQALVNPYGTGNAADNIADALLQLDWSQLGQKQFYDKP